MKTRNLLLPIILFVIFVQISAQNTIQTVHSVRNPSREASTQIDAAYSNPAGLTKLDDGFHFSFANQSLFQTGTITSTFAPFAGNGGNPTKEFKGTTTVPIIPSLQAAYKKDKWALSLNLAVSGSGKTTFSNGLPSFETGISLVPGIINTIAAAQGLPPNVLSAKGYSVKQYMVKSSFIYGIQIGGTYEINKLFSAYGGFRLNIVNNAYEGHLRNLKVGIVSDGLTSVGIPNNDGSLVSTESVLNLVLQSPNLSDSERQSIELLRTASKDGAYLNSKQSGLGVSPIIGLNINYEKLNIGIKYEFRTNLNVTNNTEVDDTDMFNDGVNTPHHIPALFTIGASYPITDKLLASVSYHYSFDSKARIANNRQEYINCGTSQYLAGLEYTINDMFLISAGVQLSNRNVDEKFQTDLDFALSSFSFGFGGAADITKQIRLNAGYMLTNYNPYTKESKDYHNTGIQGKDIFKTSRHIFAVGIEYFFY